MCIRDRCTPVHVYTHVEVQVYTFYIYTEDCRLVEDSLQHSQVVKVTQAQNNWIRLLTGGQVCLHEWLSTNLQTSVVHVVDSHVHVHVHIHTNMSMLVHTLTCTCTCTCIHTVTMRVVSFFSGTISYQSSEPTRRRMPATKCTVRAKQLGSLLSSPSSQHQTTSMSTAIKVSNMYMCSHVYKCVLW